MDIKIQGRAEELARFEGAINSLGDGITILEAGCGNKWPLKLSVQYTLAGVDPDEAALRKRIASRGDLDEYHVATLNDVELPDDAFDVIYCSFVLEHVNGVHQVLENFSRWLKPNGLLILRIPDHRSVYGFLARNTPHWLHVWVKRYVFGMQNAGEPGCGPYPVVYERAMYCEALRKFSARHGYTMDVAGCDHYLTSLGILKPLPRLLSYLTLGVLKWRHANLAIIMRA